MRQRILITGASGFIGFHLVQVALSRGMEVFAGVRPSSRIDHLGSLEVQFVELDFESIYFLKHHIEEYRYDYIVHAAGATKAENLKQYYWFNASYTRNLAIAISKAVHTVKKFVFVSSLAALGPLDSLDAKLMDKGESKPVTDYGKSKALAETYLLSIPKLPLLIFRPTAVYGPRERDILMMLKVIQRGFEVYIGRQEQQLSFIYVKDLANLIVSALTSTQVGKAYNVSDGSTYSRETFARHAQQVLAKKTLTLYLPYGLVRTMAWGLGKICSAFRHIPTLNIDKLNELTGSNWTCDIKNLELDLQFRPSYQLAEGLAETINWYKKNKWL